MLDDYLYGHIRRILSSSGRDAPYLRETHVEHDAQFDGVRLTLVMDGPARDQPRERRVQYIIFVPRQELRERLETYPPNLLTDVRIATERSYARAFEDHLMGLELEDANREMQEASEQASSPEDWAYLYRRYCEQSERIRAHYNENRNRIATLAANGDRPVRFVVFEPLSLRTVEDGGSDSTLEVETVVATAADVARMTSAHRARYLDDTLRPVTERTVANHGIPTPLLVSNPRRQDTYPWDFQEDTTLRAEREEAKQRGEALLREHLTAEQRAQLDRDNGFEVVGNKTGKRYRIHRGRQQNVYELDKRGRKRKGWCFLPGGGLCEGDVMLAQKFALELDEAAAMKVAQPFMIGVDESYRRRVVSDGPYRFRETSWFDRFRNPFFY